VAIVCPPEVSSHTEMRVYGTGNLWLRKSKRHPKGEYWIRFRDAGGWPSFALFVAQLRKAAPAFLLLESWAPRTPTAICQAIFRTLISAFCFSFTSTIPRSPSV